MESSLEQYLNLGDSSPNSNEPSPTADFVFSQANSPGDFVRDLSQISSPDTNVPQTDPISISSGDDVSSKSDTNAIPLSQNIETPDIHLMADKTKTRAETQIKLQLVLEPLSNKIEFIHFPRKTLAKPKLLATPDETRELKSKSQSIYLDLFLVCATAVEKPEKLDQALRRARGEEAVPRRPANVTIAEMDKDDPAHPQNGGEVLICEGCKERERKRYDRKKKKAEDEQEWWTYEDERVIMINEKEFKKWKDMDAGDVQFSPRARQVEFAMRIACYCRHQEEKSPVGYRVIFTFTDGTGALVAQHTSEIFQITDDHKNKEIPLENMPQPLTIPQTYFPPQQSHPTNMMQMYHQAYDNQYPQVHSMPIYSQPQTPITNSFSPINSSFQPVSPIDAQFPRPTTPTARHTRQHTQAFSNAGMSAPNVAPAPQLGRPQPLVQTQPFSHFESPLLSPNSQFSPDVLQRPISMDNFNFTAPLQYSNHQGFASAPQSAVSTPINLSRPASPTWDQGPSSKKRQLHCFFYYADDGDTTQ
ncbi:hypothetical protein K491DRAFT_589668 [Lophiostoma macrostomum CBS 122681]|uniref:SPT23/MGA2-like DNA-binding domain-containing protein n=1 Tax=Lophiostoma macrostomum CBS 122681 TaxID=1314788 RepID=A0A6A6TL22_9PLEO|nr:hypothetical protein K491DRAFT_589668 [Lophiostoma macrostomum CBS 122681]